MVSLLRPGLSLFQGLQLSLLRWFKGQRGLITGETDIIAVSEFLLQELTYHQQIRITLN